MEPNQKQHVKVWCLAYDFFHRRFCRLGITPVLASNAREYSMTTAVDTLEVLAFRALGLFFLEFSR